MIATWMNYGMILVVLFLLELLYFRIADKCNIIDKPNERSSHIRVVLRGGGIIFTIGLWIWSIVFGFEYPWLLAGVTLAAGVSFWDDIKSLPDSVRLVVQLVAMVMVLCQIENGNWIIDNWFLFSVYAVIALFFAVGGTNIFNFMDGINGITAAYSLAMLVPVAIKNEEFRIVSGEGFLDSSLLIVVGLSVLVFSWFNFRPRGKAKCFAGDVGSIGMALILVFCVGRLMMVTGDITWIILFLVYGVDGVLTICHRIMLHENLGQAHRKHAYQLMANELKMSHVTVSLIYMFLQLAISLGFIYLCPNTIVAHWVYLVGAAVALAIAYILFMRKCYYLHEEYLKSLKAKA